jgi:UDP-glucose 4-epimerase
VLGPTSKGRWSYACSKAIDEFLALAYQKEKRLPVVVVRLFNTVGPRQTGRYGMVVPNFVKQALLGHPITVYGDGTQSRCFTYVTDVVGALVKLAEHDAAVGEVFNIGNDREEITILELARRVKERSRSRSEIVLVPYDKAYEEGFEDMPRRVPDLSKITAMIGYRPKHTLDDILTQVIDYFRNK